ncbi:hypothetical protein CW304_04355 [Bacillus sp. UFRGS-B20]|nr:hypothetical protein CW304_04355 [Bacillus sp. UFRGS-B20]
MTLEHVWSTYFLNWFYFYEVQYEHLTVIGVGVCPGLLGRLVGKSKLKSIDLNGCFEDDAKFQTGFN